MNIGVTRAEEVETLLARFFDEAEASRRRHLRQAAEEDRAELESLQMELRRLAHGLGPEHPRTLALARAVQSLEESVAFAVDLIERAERAPEVQQGDWTLAGRVLTARGEPAAGLVVRLTGEPRTEVRLPEARTDERGEFYASYRANEIAPLIKSNTSLTLTVEDSRKRQVLHRYPQPLQAQGNTALQFEIRLDEQDTKRRAARASAPVPAPAAVVQPGEVFNPFGGSPAAPSGTAEAPAEDSAPTPPEADPTG